MLTLVLALVAADTVMDTGAKVPGTTERVPLVPFYVPRDVSLGLQLNPPTVTPVLRVQWELGIIEAPRNHLVVIVSVGTGVTLGLPLGLRELYQHVAFAGFGYKSPHQVLHWGFQVGAGALWYRASFLPGAGAFENRVLGYSEGRVEVGARLSGMTVGAFIGYGAPWESFTEFFPARAYVGGVILGVFGSWR